MRLGFFTAPYAATGVALEDTLRILRKSYSPEVLEDVELGTGNYPPAAHCPAVEYLKSRTARYNLKESLAKNQFGLSALSCHGNPVHPNKEIAKSHDRVQRSTISLANKLDVGTVVAFSGLGGAGGSIIPVWITNPWPDEHIDAWQNQLEQQVKYWDRLTQHADDEGIDIAIELHPKMFMHNPNTFYAVRDAIREKQSRGNAWRRLKVNPDLSHFVWRGMDPVAVIQELGEDIAYMHAKDARVNKKQMAVQGAIDQRPFSNPSQRVWTFTYVGSGDVQWNEVIRELRRVGYDGTLSFEHEDGELDAAESLKMAVNYLNPKVPRKKAGPMTWAAR